METQSDLSTHMTGQGMLLCWLLLIASIVASPVDKQSIIKYFIDDSFGGIQDGDMIKFARDRNLLWILRAHFNELLREYKGDNQDNCHCRFCPTPFYTNTDFTSFIDAIPDDILIRFCQAPPGPFRTAMYKRVRQRRKELRHHFSFPAFPEIVRLDIYPDRLHQDALVLFNEVFDLDFNQHDDVTELAQFCKYIYPTNYDKLNGLTKLQKDRIVESFYNAFCYPIPNTEQEFTLFCFEEHFCRVFGVDPSLAAFWKSELVRVRPTVMSSNDPFENRITALHFLSHMVESRKRGCLDFDLSCPGVHELIRSASRWCRVKLWRDYYRVLLIEPGMDQRSCKPVNMIGCVIYGGLPKELAPLLSPITAVDKAHYRATFCNTPANPINFVNILSNRRPGTLLPLLRRSKRFMSKKSVQYCHDFYRLLPYSRPIYDNTTNPNNRQIFLLHSLMFKMGCFGGHLDEGMREMLEAVAELYFPTIVAELRTVIQKCGYTPTLKTLFSLGRVDRRWILEFYGKVTEPEDFNDILAYFKSLHPDTIKYHLAGVCESRKTEILNLLLSPSNNCAMV